LERAINHKPFVNKKRNHLACIPGALWLILWLAPVLVARGDGSSTSFPNLLPPERFVLGHLTNGGLIDLAANASLRPTLANRTVRGEFVEWLLTANAGQLSHDGLRLASAVIEGPVDLSNLEVPVRVQLRCCHFKEQVILTGAHFDHNLSFEGCLFSGPFQAEALRVDGSLELKPVKLGAAWETGSAAASPDSASFGRYLATNKAIMAWSPGQAEFILDSNRLARSWRITDCRQMDATSTWTNTFVANSWGRDLFIVQQYDDALAQASNSVMGLTFGPLTNRWQLATNSELLDLNSVRAEMAAALGTNAEFVRQHLLTTNAVCALESVCWRFDNPANSASRPLLARRLRDSGVNFFQPTVFRSVAWLNGANIGGKLDAYEVEFQTLGGHSLKVGDDLLMCDTHFQDAASFIFAQSGHDFSLNGSTFKRSFDCSGMNVGGSLILDGARFADRANFDVVSVGTDFKGQYVRFENRDRLAEFRGLQVAGMVDFCRAQFKGPANFILAHIKGNFQAPGATFEDNHSFQQLQALTGSSFTFNTDFGSMQVDGFAIFENVLFARSVSFRNARFANLYLDGTRWPAAGILMTYTNDPKPNEMLRLEGMDFETIRDVASGHFLHTQAQLEESQTNLLAMLANRSPYSFDIYAKLESYFQREGAPDRADEVFINAKEREGHEATGLASLTNFFLDWTVGYGRQPWKAFVESLALILIWGALCHRCMIRKTPHQRSPHLGLALFYSLNTFLPIIDLGASDLLEYRPGKEWFHYLIALEKILGYILVPLWTMALTGLIK
jgi:hypothetical protein